MNSIRTAVYAGLIAGTIDIGAASAINAAAPDRVLRAVASGLLGRAAAHGGAWVPVLGMFLQWAMSIIIAGVFLAAAAKAPVLLRRWIPAGIAYGVIIFFVMNYAVVPLSAAVFKVHFSPLSFAENMAAMLLFGLIVAYVGRRGDAAADVRGK
ncbi:MAG TPA: hypothetical protein VNH21_15245 [Steroidobacteraceae bacterium]|nr:hypothetical protein [Steroidobacteraceae bacterium]